MGKILIYYKYIPLEHPERISKWQQNICIDLKLKGRITVAKEGINGTVGGDDVAIEHYKKLVREQPQFDDIEFKESEGSADCFPRLSVVLKDEIVHLDAKDKADIKNAGLHLTPKQTHEMLSNRPDDLVVLDIRNQVETAIGIFDGAIKTNIQNFREFPGYVDKHLDRFKDKQVLMYCTAGVRCERASAYLKEKNIAKEVYQVSGGIHNYTAHYPDGFFRGKNYVFDGRIAVKINDDVLGTCAICTRSCDDYNNCINALCNKHYISCADCLRRLNSCCSESCMELVSQQKVKKRAPYFRV